MNDAAEVWIDITVYGSPYEVQVAPYSNAYRHRLRGASFFNDDQVLETEWIAGRAPDDPYPDAPKPKPV